MAKSYRGSANYASPCRTPHSRRTDLLRPASHSGVLAVQRPCPASQANGRKIRATTTPFQPRPLLTVACIDHAQTTPSQPQIRRPLPSPQRYRHISELICKINSSIDLFSGAEVFRAKFWAHRQQGPKGRGGGDGGEVLGVGQQAPSPPAMGLGNRCKLPSGVLGKDQTEVDLGTF